jgi:homoserine dehydrogenase
MAHSQPVRVVDLSDSILRSEADLAASVHRIYREWRAGAAVLVIAPAVSAEELLQRAEQLGLPPDPGAAILLRAFRRRGRVLRLVAACELEGSGLRARVEPVEMPATHPFARATGAGNALRIETTDGAVLDLAAQGAGRWPTSEAVMADLYDLLEERSARNEEVAA